MKTRGRKVLYFVLHDPARKEMFRFTESPFQRLRDAKSEIEKNKNKISWRNWIIERHEWPSGTGFEKAEIRIVAESNE